MKNRNKKVQLILLAMFITLFAGCKFWESLDEPEQQQEESKEQQITSLRLEKNKLEISVGNLEYIPIIIEPKDLQKNIKPNWEYDSSIIECDTSSSWGVTITGKKQGKTQLKCSYNGFDSVCMITVKGFEEGYEETVEPYIYSNTTILQTTPDVSERINVSLYGGDVTDVNSYTWSVDNSCVSIQPTGQYCLITAKESGYARIKVTHPKAAYPYYIGVYVFSNPNKVTYITTTNNVLTMKTEDSGKTINVDLINGKTPLDNKSFKWEIIKEKDSINDPIKLEYNANTAVVTPKMAGTCTIRVTHPEAAYPLDILCRTISIVQNVYIKPSVTNLTLKGDKLEKVTAKLENIEQGKYSNEEFNYELDNLDVAEILNISGNEVLIRGKKNGSCKLLISHPASKYKREVLIISEEQIIDAVDSSKYITTSQNYIRTKIGKEPTTVNVSLKGGELGDETLFNWEVVNNAIDGSGEVIKIETTTGKISSSRSANQSYIAGSCLVTPLKEGTAVIKVTHPKIAYPTEILVKVLGEYAVLEEPLYFTGSGLVKLLNGSSNTYTVKLKGKGKKTSDDQNIKYEVDNKSLLLSPNNNEVIIQAPAKNSGTSKSILTISHPRVEAPKKVLVLSADTQEQLDEMKVLYSDKLYYNLKKGDKVSCSVVALGFFPPKSQNEQEGSKDYDYSLIQWKTNKPDIIELSKSQFNPLSCEVLAINTGSAKITAQLEDVTCEFDITVLPEGAINTEPEVYFTTQQNVVNLKSPKDEKEISISAINLPYTEYANISWENSNNEIVEVIPNGYKANLKALKEGESIITVTHKDSQNELKIYIKVGSEYIFDTKPIVYISSQDVLTMLKDDEPQKLQAILVNKKPITNDFKFAIDDVSIAEIITQSSGGIAYIKPKKSGMAEITISHKEATLEKKVIVCVGNSKEELASMSYLTTPTNVVSLTQGSSKNINVLINNGSGIDVEGYSWESSDPNTVSVLGSGATAFLQGNEPGTAIITVTHKECLYPLTIIVQCIDKSLVAENPYIQLNSSVMNITVDDGFTDIVADLIGGDKSDYSNFMWAVDDSSICQIYGQNEVGKIKALKEGTTYVTVSHPKAIYSAQILVICEKKKEADCYIDVPTSIINMKPTDNARTLKASLVNGTETDKYNFKWSVDVFDIVDFQYSANNCVITPKQSGSCTITISHPKAAFEQTILVNVQEYSTFAFPSTNITINQGDASFINMQVPNTKVTTHVEYSVDDPSKCSITGTKAVAQITALESGTTTVRAKLIASSTGIVQAQTEMMIYVKEKAISETYITSSNTIYTIKKDKSQTISANLTGGILEPNDDADLCWSTTDTDIIKITGLNSNGLIYGKQIYVKALKSGEALVTCSHKKAKSNLQFYIVVPGVANKAISLDKNYATVLKGSSGTKLTAQIENSESNNDYNNIKWSIRDTSGNNKDIARIMGSGKSVTIYPITVGECEVIAELQNEAGELISHTKCTIIVKDTKKLIFEASSRKVQPFHSIELNYTVSPTDAILNWTTTQQADYYSFKDNGYNKETGKGSVTITGLKEGNGVLYCTTDNGSKASCTIDCAWDYSFQLKGETTFLITPLENKVFEYQVNPIESIVSVQSNFEDYFNASIDELGNGKGRITITPKKETDEYIDIIVKATNPNKNNEVVGQKLVKAHFNYESITPKITLIKSDGIFSKWNEDANVLIIGDGETAELKVAINEKNTNAYVEKVTFSGNKEVSLLSGSKGKDFKTYKFINKDDRIEEVYYVESAKRPVWLGKLNKDPSTGEYVGSRSEYVVIEDWKTDFEWVTDTDSYVEWFVEYTNDYAGMLSKTYSILDIDVTTSSGSTMSVDEDNSWVVWNNDSGEHLWGNNFTKIDNPKEQGKFYSKEEFESIAWYYCPGIPDFGTGGTTSYEEGIMTENVTASLRNTLDKTVVSGSGEIGTAYVYINHNNKPQKPIEIKVFLEIRNCNKNCN